jgi:hypothetical protein
VSSDHGQLSPRQQALLDLWLPGATVEHDHSWGLVGTTVLEVRAPDGASYVVKAGGPDDHHIVRELAAHRQWLEPWVSASLAPGLVHGDDEAKLLVTTYLPGRLVEGTGHEWDLDTYSQAGDLLARFHGQRAFLDDGEFERRQKAETLAWLSRPHRIAADAVAVLTADVTRWPSQRSLLVPTHGDWQPRNWLIHDGRVGVIDFGRADLRPAHTDLGRLAAQQFKSEPALEGAFFDGYGADPREPGAWLRTRIREAVGTAAWAFTVGDEPYEQHGHRMVADVLEDLHRLRRTAR